MKKRDEVKTLGTVKRGRSGAEGGSSGEGGDSEEGDGSGEGGDSEGVNYSE